jgi:hypothetical protein
MIGAVVANAFLMTITFQLFHYTRKKLGSTIGYLSLFIYWISFEYLHMNWDLSWPWLTFGNGFASWANMVQWYEYTGVFGGTIWIILANIIVYKFLNEELDVDPCFEKSVKFYQSKEGRELLDLMKKQIDGKIKLTKEEKKRLRYLVRLTPKC